jgi:hypothetical protein
MIRYKGGYSMRFVPVFFVSILFILNGGSSFGQTEGLLGEYFNTVNMTDLAVTRIDPQVNFAWDTGVPHPSLSADHFSICWTGLVTPVQGGLYTFYVTSDDGVRLWINNSMVVNQWKGQSPTEYSATVTLTGGQTYPIRIDYYENTGGAMIKLEWEGPGQTRGPIEASRLTPGTGLGDRLLDWHVNPANGHYYKIFGPTLTWAQGKAKASASGGYLATISDAAENEWIMGMFRPVSDVGFIGANDIAAEGVWVWDQTRANFWNGAANGTAVPGFYTNWNTGEPNNANGEHVATVHLGSGVWNDLNVARERYCIIESETGQINYDGPLPGNKTLQVGQQYQVSVVARQIVGTVRYQWYKDDIEISSANSATLTIPYVGYDHEGIYTCQISDDKPATVRTRPAKLFVVEKIPALSFTGLVCLATLITLGAVRRAGNKR